MERVQRETDPYFTVYNLGINGDTSAGLIQRFERETVVRFVRAERNIVLFSIGINDCVLIDDRDYNVAPEEFRNNMAALISLARKFGHIVIVGLHKVEETRTTPIPWHKRWYYRNASIQMYDAALREVAAQEKVTFIDLLPLFSADYYELLDDGLHPNAEGHQKIFKLIQTQLTNHNLL